VFTSGNTILKAPKGFLKLSCKGHEDSNAEIGQVVLSMNFTSFLRQAWCQKTMPYMAQNNQC